jgi:hypothetical protein
MTDTAVNEDQVREAREVDEDYQFALSLIQTNPSDLYQLCLDRMDISTVVSDLLTYFHASSYNMSDGDLYWDQGRYITILEEMIEALMGDLNFCAQLITHDVTYMADRSDLGKALSNRQARKMLVIYLMGRQVLDMDNHKHYNEYDLNLALSVFDYLPEPMKPIAMSYIDMMCEYIYKGSLAP